MLLQETEGSPGKGENYCSDISQLLAWEHHTALESTNPWGDEYQSSPGKCQTLDGGAGRD